MSATGSTACERFDEHADALALGQVDEPLRSQLLAHAADCPHCHSLLGGLGTVVDRLLLVAPHVEPPAGFESRALARLGAAPSSPARPQGLPWWAAAVSVVLVGVGAFGISRVVDDRSDRAPTAAIVSASGAEVGSVRLVSAPQPHVLVSVTAPRPDPGVRHCELKLADGEWVEVGTWEVADLAAGVWAAGIAAELLDAEAMRVTLDDGTVVATATFG